MCLHRDLLISAQGKESMLQTDFLQAFNKNGINVLLYIQNEKMDNCLYEYFFIPGAIYTLFSYSILVFLSTIRNLVAIVYRKTIANNIRDCYYGKLKVESLV